MTDRADKQPLDAPVFPGAEYQQVRFFRLADHDVPGMSLRELESPVRFRVHFLEDPHAGQPVGVLDLAGIRINAVVGNQRLMRRGPRDHMDCTKHRSGRSRVLRSPADSGAGGR